MLTAFSGLCFTLQLKQVSGLFVDNILLVIKHMGKRIFIGNPPNNLLVLLGFTIIVLWSRLQQMKERQNLGKFILTLDL